MRLFMLAIGIVAACSVGCSKSGGEKAAKTTSPPAVQIAGTPYGEFVIGEPITHDNLTIFPISSKMPKNSDRYITLDEGLANGTVKIIEVGAEQTGDERSDSGSETNPNDQPSQPPTPQQPAAPANPERNGGDDRPNVCEEEAATTGSQVNPPVQEPPATPPAQEAANTADDLFGPGNGNDNIEVPFRQTGAGADVNKLMVLNTSGKPLYLMPGEVISGGNQDRTIGQEIVIDSSDKAVPIDVFCVEHGRWGGRGAAGYASQLAAAADFDSNLSLVVSQTQAPAVPVEELAKQAQQGKFVASLGQLSKDGRLAVQHASDQSKVWDEVSKQNLKVGNTSGSDNFAENYASEDISKSVDPYVKKLLSAGETPQVVGVAVAVNGKMLSVDVFESTPLFKKFWRKLVKSHALDAVGAKGDKEAGDAQKPIGVEDCVAFLKEMEKAKAETVELASGHKLDKRDSAVGASFSYHDPKAASAAGIANEPAAAFGENGGFGGGGFGGGVHTGVLAK